jgi:hypothetical protein
MRNNIETNLGWTALRAGALALGLVAFSAPGFAQSYTNPPKATGLPQDSDARGLNENNANATTGAGSMEQKGTPVGQQKEWEKAKANEASHGKELPKDADGRGGKEHQ